jgi:hypothetical protein
VDYFPDILQSKILILLFDKSKLNVLILAYNINQI